MMIERFDVNKHHQLRISSAEMIKDFLQFDLTEDVPLIESKTILTEMIDLYIRISSIVKNLKAWDEDDG